MACILAAGVPAVLGSSADPKALDFLGGAAWLISEARGELVRVNGPNAKVDAKIADLGSGLGAVSQDKDTVLVTVDGQIRSVNIADLSWGAGPISGQDSALVVGDGVAWLVTAGGKVSELDPTTLETRGRLQLGGTPGRAVVAGDRLVVPLDDGTVRVVEGHEATGKIEVGEPDDLIHVATVGKRAVALNQSIGRVFRLDVAENEVVSKADVELPDGELLVPPELPRGPLWLLARQSGELVRVGPRTGSSRGYPAVTPGGDVSGPAAAAGAVYLLDRGAQEIAVFDTKTKQVHREPFPDGVTDPTRVELVVEGGYVFVNDLLGSGVVVFGDDGTRHDIDKYDTEGVPGDEALPPPAEEPAPTPGSGPPEPAPPATDPPAPPREVTAVAGNASATVAWDHGAGTTPASAYHITYEGLRRPIDVSGDTTSVTIDGLRNGQTYVFEVWASNDYGESDPVRSNEVEPSDEVPGSPTNVAATAGDTDARVTWDAADDRGNDITDYIVTAAPGGRTATVAGNATSATVTGLTNDTSYTFTVVAVNRLGIQGAPSAPSAPVVPYGVPAPLANLRASSGDSNVDLSWSASASRTPVTYTIASSRAIGGRSSWTTTATSWSSGGLTNGNNYTFTVTPSNDRGNGRAGTANVTPGRAPAVSNVGATLASGREIQVSYDYDGGGLPVTCQIQVRSGANYPDDGCDGFTFDAPNYNTAYSFTVTVTNSRGSNTGSAGVTTDTKPYTVRSDGSAFDGSCTWNPDAGGRPNTRGYFANPRHTCPMWDPPEDRPIGYLPLGTSVRGECHTQGGDIRDDNLVSTTTWIRITGRGWMPTIYFTNYQNGPIDNLPAC